MICFLAMLVFGVLGIFSATHRAYAVEAFDCVFRRVTLRKCNTSFDKKMRMKVSTGLMKRNRALGALVFRHFEAISWFFTILMVASLLYSAYSVYNIAVYGTCTPENPEACILTPPVIGEGESCSCVQGEVSCSAAEPAGTNG